jgi:hypothetical protein
MKRQKDSIIDEWESERFLAGETGPFGTVSDIPPEVWGDGEFDAKGATETIRLIENNRRQRQYSLGIPGVKPPDHVE